MIILALIVGDLDQHLVKSAPADVLRVVSSLQEVRLDSVFVVGACYYIG